MGCLGCGTLGCEMIGMYDVWDVRCLGCGMLGNWDVRDMGCSECGMFGMCVVWDVGWGCLLGCVMFVFQNVF